MYVQKDVVLLKRSLVSFFLSLVRILTGVDI